MIFSMIAGSCTTRMFLEWANAVILGEKPFVWYERAMLVKKITAIANVGIP